MSGSDPMAINEVMDGLLRSLRGGRPGPTSGAVGSVFGSWDTIVGAAVASHVRPVRLDEGRLIVEVSDPTWATQVRLLTEQLRERLRDVAGVHIDSIDVRVSGSRRPGRGARSERSVADRSGPSGPLGSTSR